MRNRWRRALRVKSRRRWAVLGAAALGGLFVWMVPSAPDPPSIEPSPRTAPEPPEPPEPGLEESRERPSILAQELRSPSPDRPERGLGRPSFSPVPAPALALTARAFLSRPAAVRLPLPLEELGEDGLPVTGMRCTWDGAAFDCGTCRTDGDCPPEQGCVANRQTRRFECMASECEEDVHCFPGFLCRAVTSGTTGAAIIRRCVRAGLRGPREPCDLLPVSPLGSCREGLVCVEQECAPRCRPEDPSSCPAGYTCEDGLDGAGCTPDCRWLGCAEGFQCQKLREGEFRCLASATGDCRDTPCPEGEHCNVRGVRGHAVFWCARLCNPLLRASCPEGQVCGMGSATVSTCFRRCDPTMLDACGEGWTCATVSEDMTLFGCRPEMTP